MLSRLTWVALAVCVMGGVAGCGAPSGPPVVQEVMARDNIFPSYPQPDRTYLSFSSAHGFQVNYLRADGRAWLWYPGNSVGVPEEYETRTVNGTKAICWRHPSDSYKPVTRQHGGEFVCTPLELAQKANVAVLRGDPFSLASGKVPYRLDRCKAPEEFNFDRNRFGC